MLKSLKTKNFRKLKDNHFEFDSGMVVIRGANEGGKSTTLEAISYALFGVKACRESLADVVTWGQPEASLSVELVINFEGVDYNIKRSKAGAEITYEGGRITGQTECSNFVESLFGINNGNIGKLVSSSQGDIRGALSQGPKATMELIENLANFDLIDNVIDLVQANLLTGPTTAAEALKESAMMRLELAQANAIAPDNEEWEVKAKAYDTASAKDVEAVKAMEPQIIEAEKEARKAFNAFNDYENLKSKIAMFKESLAQREVNVAMLKNNINNAPKDIELITAEAKHAAALGIEALKAERKAMTDLMNNFPESFWEGSFLSLTMEIEATSRTINNCKVGITKLEGDLRVLESQKVTGSVCGFCNQDVSQFPEVLAKNNRIEADIVKVTKDLADAKVVLADAVETLPVLTSLAKQGELYASKGSDNVEGLDETVPPRLTWVGPTDFESLDVKALRDNLEDIRKAIANKLSAEGRLAGEIALIADYADKVASATEELDALGQVDDFEASRVRHTKLLNDFTNLKSSAVLNSQEATAIRRSIQEEESKYQNALAIVADAQVDVDSAKEAITQLEFNNALLKRIRAARPLIADKLWNVVLSAVSSYFSTMRGTASVVSKTPEGFKVDGQNIGGLSGSTLDILGLAIRLALTRTFIPAAPFLILDEATAAMDERRSAEMMAFLLAFGFKQTICVTHKDIEEGAANQLIQL